MKLFIRNMVGSTSVEVVKNIFKNFGLQPVEANLGEIVVDGHISYQTYRSIAEALFEKNFELVKNEREILTEKIQNAVLEMIFYSETLPVASYSSYLSRKLGMNYSFMSRFFSEVRGFTIEKFILTQKIERAKQMLMFYDLSLNDIAQSLQYSSANQLCVQFKKFTGYSPGKFRKAIS